jgi:hypothetical protein
MLPDLLKTLSDIRTKLLLLAGQVDGVFVNKNYKRLVSQIDEITITVVKAMNTQSTVGESGPKTPEPTSAEDMI